MSNALAAADVVTQFACRQGDRCLVLSHRLQQCITHAPQLEEELAIANIALDLLGQARSLYTYAAGRIGPDLTEDDLAFGRDADEFWPPALVEQPNTDFALVMGRQLLHDLWADELWRAMRSSTDPTLAAIAGKAAKETAYHLMHASTWVVTLGDSTPDAHDRMSAALTALWPFVDELFSTDDLVASVAALGVAPDPATLRRSWDARLDAILEDATLTRPTGQARPPAGRDRCSDDLRAVIDELHELHAQHPGARW
jgi:ring-1,2-phenylacetyl-CoA epoxidase subunit PaaC